MLSQDPLSLPSEIVPGLSLRLRQQYRTITDPGSPGRWRVSTLAYQYRLGRADTGAELLSWHWHPRSPRDRPHLHVTAPPVTRRQHIPTGHVSIESILRLLIEELGVSPSRAHADDYPDVLDTSERAFVEQRRWSN